MQRKQSSKVMAVFSIFAITLLLVPGTWASGRKGGRDSVEAVSGGEATFTVLYNFGGSAGDPIGLGGVMAQGRDGDLYSTTSAGGAYNLGTAFKITSGGGVTVLYSFTDPLDQYGGPGAGLILGTSGSFYGSCVYCGGGSGYGTVFEIASRGKLTTLYDFSGQNYDAYPDAPPIEATDGNFYGTALGGFNGNGGEIYRVSPSGDETSLFKFDRKDGANPADPLVQATDGNFYGTTSSGGTSGRCEQYGCGTVFRLTPKGAFKLLHSFNVNQNDGYYPIAPLIEGNDGNFYGTVPHGGKYGYGDVFKITSTGKLTVLHGFNITDGRTPQAAVVQATDGSLYGTTEGGGTSGVGTVFRVSPSGRFSVLYSLDGASGTYPTAALIQHTDGKLYGFGGQGGTYNYGTFFSVDLGLGPFVSLVSASGRVGRLVEILGQGFTGTTDVSFNGTSAKFKVVSDTYMTATVPGGATTGFVTVATPGGPLKSSKKFRVTR